MIAVVFILLIVIVRLVNEIRELRFKNDILTSEKWTARKVMYENGLIPFKFTKEGRTDD